MNIYRCVSETLTGYDSGPYYPESGGPPEDYYIAELVAAEKPGTAKWTAWQTDGDSFTGRIIDIPKFSVVRTRRDVRISAGVISHPRPAWWSTAAEIRGYWRTRKEVPQ